MEIVFSILPADWASPVGDQVGDTRWPGLVAVRDGLRVQLLVDLHDDLGPSRLVLLLRVRALGSYNDLCKGAEFYRSRSSYSRTVKFYNLTEVIVRKHPKP